MDRQTLQKLPSPFYRVSIKAIILDEQSRLLIGAGNNSEIQGWEIPGGGFEYSETIQQCLARELKEELGAEIESVGKLWFVYRGRSKRGWMILRVAVEIKLKNFNFKFGDMEIAKFVTKAELLQTDFDAEEGTIKDYADYIWP